MEACRRHKRDLSLFAIVLKAGWRVRRQNGGESAEDWLTFKVVSPARMIDRLAGITRAIVRVALIQAERGLTIPPCAVKAGIISDAAANLVVVPVARYDLGTRDRTARAVGCKRQILAIEEKEERTVRTVPFAGTFSNAFRSSRAAETVV